MLLSACEYTEILIINPDGSAVVRIEIDSNRDEFSDTSLFGIQWSTLQERAAEFDTLDDGDPLLLGDIAAERADDGTFSLSIDARAQAADFVSDLNAIRGDPFTATLGDNPDHLPITMTAELQLPGDLGENDAHEVDGNTLRWSWTVGQEGAPGLSAQWDPDPDGGSEFSVPREIVIWVVATIAVFGLGVLAAAFGLFEAGRVSRRDQRHLG